MHQEANDIPAIRSQLFLLIYFSLYKPTDIIDILMQGKIVIFHGHIIDGIPKLGGMSEHAVCHLFRETAAFDISFIHPLVRYMYEEVCEILQIAIQSA